MRCRSWIVLVFLVGTVIGAPTENCKNDVHAEVNGGKTWVLIVAGSNTNFGGADPESSLAYAIQASAYRAYHVLRDRGIPKEQIVLFSWDDAAFIKGYKHQGKLFNRPDKKDVRKGVAIDYRGRDVTIANILAVLTGDKSAVKGGNGRVIESAENDKVFVYFMNHGKVGGFYIGDGNEFITKKDFNETLTKMHSEKKYAQLTFYMDACFSGSIFDTMPAELNIYAVSSASQAEGANVMYCPWDCENGTDDPQQCAVIEDVGTCLSALFSGLWLDDIVGSDPNETLDGQFKSLKRAVAESKDDSDDQKVSHWGDLRMAKEHVSDFQGRANATKQTSLKRFKPLGATPIDEVPLRMHVYRARKQAMAEGLSDDLVKQRVAQAYAQFLAESSSVHKFFADFIEQVLGSEDSASDLINAELPLTQLECHHDAVHAFAKKCSPRLAKNPYAMHYPSVIANLCESGVRTSRILQAIDEFC